MNQNQKEHFLHWLMYALVFFCTGPVGIILWSAYCLVKYDKSEREYEMRKIPIQYRPDIRAMNTEEYKKEHLTEEERERLDNNSHLIFVVRDERGYAIFRYIDVEKDY